jgi:hypothetical protein
MRDSLELLQEFRDSRINDFGMGHVCRMGSACNPYQAPTIWQLGAHEFSGLDGYCLVIFTMYHQYRTADFRHTIANIVSAE